MIYRKAKREGKGGEFSLPPSFHFHWFRESFYQLSHNSYDNDVLMSSHSSPFVVLANSLRYFIPSLQQHLSNLKWSIDKGYLGTDSLFLAFPVYLYYIDCTGWARGSSVGEALDVSLRNHESDPRSGRTSSLLVGSLLI